jgi:hypothetical protein
VTRFLTIFSLAAAVALCTAVTVSAARPPTRVERQAITNALPTYVRAMPVGCVWLNIRVSKNPSYAYVAPEMMNAVPTNTQCRRYASNGFYILKKSTSGKWTIIFNGSVWPPCSRHIPRDLVRCA